MNRTQSKTWLACAAAIVIFASSLAFAAPVQSPPNSAAAGAQISTADLDHQIRDLLTRDITAHIADIKALDPPPERVVGALTTGDFSWGTFMRAVAAYSELSGAKTIAGRDVPTLIGKIGLIEARQGGKTFAQLYAALALRHFGTDLSKNAVWQSLSLDEQKSWRSLLDPARFYNRETHQVINLPQNYFGVAARIATMDFQLGIISDRTYVDDILERAAQQFVSGSLYSDDALPAGRYDRYSNEYARYVYEAAENVGRKDIMSALEPTLKTQMRLWWDLLQPDGYGYAWGRSLGAISYMDTMEIVAFDAKHPQFRPAPLQELASAYYNAWEWLRHDVQPDRHLLNVFGFGRGDYSYINPQREWQQTTGFMGKVTGADLAFMPIMKQENISAFSAEIKLPDVARFEYFRKGERPSGVWLVRQGAFRFTLPIVTGMQPGISDYLPAPYGLSGFAAPVEQFVPVMTPYFELEDGRVIVAGDCADEIYPAADGRSLRVVWKNFAQLGKKSGETLEAGFIAEVNWKIEGTTIVRTETITSSKQIKIRRFWVIVPTSGDRSSTRFENNIRTDQFDSPEGSLEVSVAATDFPLNVSTVATGNSNLGKGNRGAVPLYLELDAKNLTLQPNEPVKWTLRLRAFPSTKPDSTIPTIKPNPDVLH
nr:hypothetical protein [Candidatus Acidoferrales bacterium]